MLTAIVGAASRAPADNTVAVITVIGSVLGVLAAALLAVYRTRREDKRLERQLDAASERDTDAWSRERASRWDERIVEVCAQLHASTSQTVRLISQYAGQKHDADSAAERSRLDFDDERQRSRALVAEVRMIAPALTDQVKAMFKCVQPLREIAYTVDHPQLTSAEWKTKHQETRDVRERFIDAVNRELEQGRLRPDLPRQPQTDRHA